MILLRPCRVLQHDQELRARLGSRSLLITPLLRHVICGVPWSVPLLCPGRAGALSRITRGFEGALARLPHLSRTVGVSDVRRRREAQAAQGAARRRRADPRRIRRSKEAGAGDADPRSREPSPSRAAANDAAAANDDAAEWANDDASGYDATAASSSRDDCRGANSGVLACWKLELPGRLLRDHHGES